jgi:hypothetical protein
MPTQQAVRTKRQGRTNVILRKNGKTRAGVVLAVTAYRGVSIPVAGTFTPVASGGSLADGTYGYRISAVGTGGAETLASVTKTATVAGGGGSGSVVLNWGAVTGATNYKIYGRTGGSELLLATVGAVTTYTDTNATPAGALPTLATATATVATRYSNNAPKSGVTGVVQNAKPFTSTTKYTLRFGTPAGYATPQRS